jgi:hypothetical protein
MPTPTVTDPDAAAVATSAALKTTVAGGGLVSFGGLTANDWAIVGGLVIAVAGFLLQWHFQRRRDRREVEEHEARMELLRANTVGLTDE